MGWKKEEGERVVSFNGGSSTRFEQGSGRTFLHDDLG